MPNLSRSKGSHAEAIVKDINTILVRNGISETIFPEDITVTDKAVSDHVKPVSKLSDCITEYLWPSIRSEVLSHYTSWEAAESIGRSKTFRFGNIEKRYGEGEITTFCQVHQLHGYLAPDAHGEPRYKNLLMPNMFYASFTDSAVGRDEEEYFWRNVSGGDGVRLTMSVEASNPNLRRILYGKNRGEPIPILSQLTEVTRAEHHREFILTGISRLCAFYLSEADYGSERESRLILKTWEGIAPQPIGTGPTSYVEIPLGVMTECGYRLEILNVCANMQPATLADYPFMPRMAR